MSTVTYYPTRYQSVDTSYVEDKKTSHPMVHRWYPISHILMSIWLAYIVGMLVLLQMASQFVKLHTHLPWYYEWLPGVMLTGFAQMHLPITATYLSRLGLCALQHRHTQPHSWAELLWLAGGKWQGPIGLATLWLNNRTLQRALSSTFVLFAFAGVIANATPIVVSRAWPAAVVQVPVRSAQTTSALNPNMLGTIDYEAEFVTGQSGWATGLPVEQILSSSTFVPQTPSTEHLNDLFFAGAVSGDDATLKGVRVQGGCATLPEAPRPTSNDSFIDFCHAMIPNVPTIRITNFQVWTRYPVEWWFCTDYDPTNGTWMNSAPAAPATAIVWLNYIYTDQQPSGYMQCNASFAMGTAAVSGTHQTFADFAEAPWYDTSMENIPILNLPLHPLYAALSVVAGTFTGRAGHTQDADGSFWKILGFSPFFDTENQRVAYDSPTMDTVAAQLWQGTAHMGAAINVLATAPNETYHSTALVPVSGRRARVSFIAAGLALLGVWFVVLVVCTLRMSGRAFGGALDIYVAARQFAEEPELLRGQPYGDMADNPRLKDPYEFKH